MRALLSVLILSSILHHSATAQVPSADAQIASAVQPLPEELRADATVLGYGETPGLVTLRPGSNGMICLADDPEDDRFHVACYHKSLEPFMARGRELRAAGMGRDEVEAMRRNEITDGGLAIPEQAAALYSLSGEADGWDPSTGEIHQARALHVVYLPFATLEETGLPARAPAGRPWLMDPGEPWAHIMLVIPEESQNP